MSGPLERPSARPFPQLPIHASRFIGRRRETAEVGSLVARTRLVTIIGAAGSGKTRLAMEAARRISKSQRVDACLVELASVGEPGMVPHAFASALGITESQSRPVTEMLVERLAGFTGIIVVDNCEHLVEACAELVDRLLRRCPTLSILATSREPLHVDGESVWLVPTLSVPHAGVSTHKVARSEAVQLFVERAQQVAREFQLTASNAEDVGAICRRLDGLPLAIELAASRTAQFMPKSILEQLTDRFRFLTGGLRTAPPRHKTLRAAIDWSYDLLTVAERELFARVSVFAGEFDASAAQEVGSGGSVHGRDLLDVLGRLIDKSLIVAVDGTVHGRRYRLLESLRAYGLERLSQAGELESRRRRHAEYFTALASAEDNATESLRFPRVPLNEIDNLREALAWSRVADPALHLQLACAFGWFCVQSGYVPEGRSFLEVAVEGAPDNASSAQANLVLSALAWRQEDSEAAERYASNAVALSRDLNNPARLARTLGNLAFIRIGALHLDAADAPLEEELSIVNGENDTRLKAEALFHAGLLEAHRGQLSAAQQHLAESIALHDAVGKADDNAPVDSVFGWVLLMLGDVGAAHTAIARALKTRVRLQAVSDAAASLDALAEIAFLQGAPKRAMRLKGAADVIYERGGAQLPSMTAVGRARWVAEAERSLGSEARSAWVEGRGLTLEQAADYATGSGTEPGFRSLSRDAPLTTREVQVAKLVATGLTNDAIALRLGVSVRTVDAHLDHIRTKLGVRSRVEISNWIAHEPAASPR
jgi:predicted ATPase/DNA-binding CsgD family transcriptional regulator